MAPENGLLYPSEMVAEMKAYNATLKQATSPRHRPRHPLGRGLNGRGRGIIRGGAVSGISPGRPPLTNSNTIRPIGETQMMGNNVVGPRVPQQARGGYYVGNQASYTSPQSTNHFWSALASPYYNPMSDTTAPAPKLYQTTHTSRSSLSVSQSQGLSTSSVGATGLSTIIASQNGLVIPPPTPTSFSYRNGNDPQPVGSSARQLIVTNWGPDPIGPVISGHMRQPSAAGAIAEMAQSIGMSYDDLTTDGISISISHSRAASQQEPSTSKLTILSPEASTEMESDTDMDMISAILPTSNLRDSQWVAPTWNLTATKSANVAPTSTVQNICTVEKLKDSKCTSNPEFALKVCSKSTASACSYPSKQTLAPTSTIHTLGTTNNLFASVTATIPPQRAVAIQTPVSAAANPKKPAQYLKDSMWA